MGQYSALYSSIYKESVPNYIGHQLVPSCSKKWLKSQKRTFSLVAVFFWIVSQYSALFNSKNDDCMQNYLWQQLAPTISKK